MQLISILAAGVNGAESGQATISVRGTSQPATTYASFEGAGPSTTGTVVLDANGGIEVYVNQYVDVVVADSQGNTVREFTQGDATSAQEYIGQSFTGVGYDESAPLVVNQGVTTQAVLNKWLDSAGAPDWKVLLAGTEQNLTTALGNLPGLIFNVKNAAYGAVGDGVTDDTTAIAAAITAAAAGGIVFFPQGTYRLTAALTPAAGVSLKGVGASESKLVMDDSATATLIPGAAAGVRCFIEDLSFTSSQNNSASLIAPVSNWEADINRCAIGDLFNTANFIAGTSLTLLDVSIRNCVFGALAATASAVNFTGITGDVRLKSCSFVTPATYNVTTAVVHGVGLTLEGCFFDVSASTSGTFSVFKSSSTTLRSSIIGCNFSDSGGATVVGITLGAYLAASVFVEASNTFPLTDANGFTAYSYDAGSNNPDGAMVNLVTRETRVEVLSENAATQTVNPKQYGMTVCSRSGTTDPTVTALTSEQMPEGATYMLVVEANGGAITTVTYNINGLVPVPGAAGLTNGNRDIFIGKSARTGFAGNRLWMQAARDV